MKNLLLSLVCFCCCISLSAQFQIMGSDEFGRIFDLTYDETIQDKVYALTLGNHIVSSDDNGGTWQIMYSHPFGKTEGLSFLDTNNKLSFYSSHGANYALYLYDLSVGAISKTYNLPALNKGEWIGSYDIWASNPDVAIVEQSYMIGTVSHSKIQYTTDGGNTWNEVYESGNNYNINVENVAISPADSLKVFLARGNGNSGVYGGLLVSSDAGQTWTENMAGINFRAIAFNPDNASEIWAGSGYGNGPNHQEGLYHSTDAGATWTLVPIAWTDYIMDCINVIKFNPSNTDNIVILEENEIAISDDGGQTWDLHVYPNASDNVTGYYYGLNLSFNPFQADELVVSANYYPLFSSDNGQTLSKISTPFFTGYGNVHHFKNQGEEHLYYGAQYGFVHKDMSTMQENAYNLLPLNMFTNDSPTAIYIDRHKAGRVYVFSDGFSGGQLKVSEDHGETQQTVYSTFADHLNTVESLSGNTNVIWASFSMGGNEEVKEIDFSTIANPQVTSITLPNTQGIVKNILFEPTDPSHVLISQGGHVFQSQDAGDNWTETSTGLGSLGNNDLILKLSQNPFDGNQLTIATSNGLFTSYDYGQNWGQISPAMAHNIKHSTVHNGDIVAVVHNSNVSNFEIMVSRNDGTSWESITADELFYLNTSNVFSSSAIDFEGNNAVVYISTGDLGLVKYTIDLNNLSVDEIEVIDTNPITVYPNPTSKMVSINSKWDVLGGKVYDLNGRQIMDFDSEKTDISHLPAGIYIIKVRLSNGKSVSHKIIKK